MACLLQPEFNILYSFFRCKLLIEVVDVEVKITSMQGTHIFRRDWTTQLIKCTPWSTRLHPHPQLSRKWKPFWKWRVRWAHFQHPLANSDPHCQIPIPALERTCHRERKRATPKKFRPATPKPTAASLPLPEAPPKPKNDAPLPSIPVHKSTPWPGTGNVSGNLFEDWNRLLPPNYLDYSKENKTENEPKAATNITSPKPPIKEEESKTSKQPTEKCSWGPGCPFCKSKEQKEEQTRHNYRGHCLKQTASHKTKNSKFEHDQGQTAVGRRDGKVKF